MYKQVSSCTKCGNPIYAFDYHHTASNSSAHQIKMPQELLPQIMRTCQCGSNDNEHMMKRIETLESMLSVALKLLHTTKDKEEEEVEQTENKLLKG